MSNPASSAGSIRRRLIVQLLLAAAMVAGLLYLSMRSVASIAVEQTQDRILGAATLAIAEELRGGSDGVEIDIPYSAFSMLGALGDDRIFYRILIGGETVTGYEDLPLPETAPGAFDPMFYSATYQNTGIRVAAVSRAVLADNRQRDVLVLVGQTLSVQEAIVADMANRAAMIGAGFFSIAALLALLTARIVIQPINSLADAVSRRGPQDLRAVERPVPQELKPFVVALNGFIARLSGALDRTETFITEAAHYIRTPLSTLRTQSEIALHKAEDAPTRDRLRQIIRLADDTARSASQLLDHAAVIHRTDQRSDTSIDLAKVARDVTSSFEPSAELRDIALNFSTTGKDFDIVADRLLIETVIRNLIDNALKYSDAESDVEVIVESTDRHLSFTVSDQGRGLGGADGSDLQRRFSRGGNVKDVVGSGLGLSMVRDVAAIYHATFELTDRQEGGACASFSLPR